MALINMTGRKWKTKQEIKRRRRKIIFGLFIIFILVLGAFFISNRITTVEIEGNEYYTDEEIKNLIISEPLEQNAWYLYWKYKYTATDEIPFIDTVEIDVTGTGKIKVTVYEKSIVGMVEYLDNYMYFDKDGIIVESSKKVIDNVPQITGLSFDNLSLYEQLPVEEPKVFGSILTLTQMLNKNEIIPDKIHINKSLEITLTFNEAKVLLGNDENLAEKIIRLKYLMTDLTGRKGILHMENFNEETKNITFENM